MYKLITGEKIHL